MMTFNVELRWWEPYIEEIKELSAFNKEDIVQHIDKLYSQHRPDVIKINEEIFND